MIEFTKDQYKKAKKLTDILFEGSLTNPEFRHSTKWGVKTNTGIINTILEIMYGIEG